MYPYYKGLISDSYLEHIAKHAQPLELVSFKLSSTFGMLVVDFDRKEEIVAKLEALSKVENSIKTS
jgi:hypothetical protein